LGRRGRGGGRGGGGLCFEAVDVRLDFHSAAVGENPGDGLLVLAVQPVVGQGAGEGGAGQLPLDGAGEAGGVEGTAAAGRGQLCTREQVLAGLGGGVRLLLLLLLLLRGQRVGLRVEVRVVGLLVRQHQGALRRLVGRRRGAHLAAHLAGADLAADLAAGGRRHGERAVRAPLLGGGGGRRRRRVGARAGAGGRLRRLGAAAGAAVLAHAELHHDGAQAVRAAVALRQRAQLLGGGQAVGDVPHRLHGLGGGHGVPEAPATQDEELVPGRERDRLHVGTRDDGGVEEGVAHDPRGVRHAVHLVVLRNRARASTRPSRAARFFFFFNGVFEGLYLGDDGPVLPDPAVFLLQAHVLKQRQRQRLPVAAQDGLALAHVGRREREAAAGVGGVVAEVAQDRRAAQFLPRGSQFPLAGKGRGGGVNI